MLLTACHTSVWQAVSNKSKRQVQNGSTSGSTSGSNFNVRFNVRFKFHKYSTSGSNFNLTFNVRFNVRFIFQPDIQHELRPYQFGGYRVDLIVYLMEDKREEKTVLCVFGEKEACSSNAAEERKNLMKTIISMYWWRLLQYSRHLRLGGMRVKKSISECENVV